LTDDVIYSYLHIVRIVPLFAVFVIIFCRAPAVQAQVIKGYSFSLCPQFGLFYGHVEEIVYPSDTRADLLSLLLWDMKPVYYYGFLMELSPVKPMEKRGFYSGLSVKFGIPGPSGVMEDRDWESKVTTELTGFSSHDNITKEIFLLDFSTGFSFPFFNALLIKTFVNISYMDFRFSGENGHGTYAREISLDSGIYYPINDAPDERQFSGKVISYKQEWLYFAPGVSVGYGYKELFLAEISFMITPLVLCFDLDEHIKRTRQYKDNMIGGIMLEPGFRCSLNMSKWLGISCDISWRYISGTRGLTYIKPIGSGKYKQVGEAGSGMSTLATSLSLKVKL
jgi:outer membrane protease